MGVTKETIKEGNGADYPKKGDEVTIEYTGNLYDESKGQEHHFRGTQYAPSTLKSLGINADQRLPLHLDSTLRKAAGISRHRLG